jgi:hypothetical protein
VVAKNPFGVAFKNDKPVATAGVEPLAETFLANVFQFFDSFVFDFAAVLPRHAFECCDGFVRTGDGAKFFEQPLTVGNVEHLGDSFLLAPSKLRSTREGSGKL